MLRLLVALVMTSSFFGGAGFAAESSKGAYPGVFDAPPGSEKPVVTKDEQSKLKDELTKSRDRANSKATTQGAPSRTKKP